MGYDPAISIPTLIGSLLSCLATSCVLLSFTIFTQQQQISFRHALVFNLALAEFINSLNNSVSGIYVVAHRHRVAPGAACELNGFVGQFSVQAADFSILAIALITLFTVINKTYIPSASRFRKLVICASVWVVPLITSSIAAGLGALQPGGGNWCWITKDRTDLRYALAHGWRFAIILATVFVYAYIYVYIQHNFSTNRALRLSVFGGYVSTAPPSRDLGKLEADLVRPDTTVSRKEASRKELQMIAEVDQEVSKRLSEHLETARQSMTLARNNSRPESDTITASTPITTLTNTTPNPANFTLDPDASLRRNSELTIDIPSHSLELHFLDYPLPPSTAILSRQRLREKPSQTLTIDTTITPSSPPPPELFESPTSIRTHMQQQSSNRHAQVEREVRRMLLLNAYPVAYVVLWLPGIANRIVEAATGSSPRWLLVLQSSTQYVGLANALTYGFNEHMRGRGNRDPSEGFGWSWRRGVV